MAGFNVLCVMDLREENILLKEQLLEALSALSCMWNQYCPPFKDGTPGHMHMSAGEEAEEVLLYHNLIKEDQTCPYFDFVGEELPDTLKEYIEEVRTYKCMG